MTDDQRDETAPPVWDEVDDDVVCPLCEYNLRGLADPRCPECGYRFTWAEILSPKRRLHPYLFEHHPERRLWSFWKTLAGTRRPRRFWRSVFPVQPSYPRRLLAYWAIIAFLYLASVAGQLTAFCVSTGRAQLALNRGTRQSLLAYYARPTSKNRVNRIVSRYGSVQRYLDIHYPAKVDRYLVGQLWGHVFYRFEYWLLLAFPLVWPWMLLGGLLVFRVSMRRARIKSVHVSRCVVYACDTALWIGMALLLCAIVVFSVARIGNQIESIARVMFWVFCVFVVVCGYRLWMAYRLYLRFEHAFAAVLASHVIAFLILINVLSALYLTTHVGLLRMLLTPEY
jgi:hypothetical protein